MNLKTPEPPWGPRYEPIWPTAEGMGTTEVIYWNIGYLVAQGVDPDLLRDEP